MDSIFDSHLIIRLMINTLFVLLITRFYYSFSRQRENAAAFTLFGTGVFVVTAMLHKVEVSMGFAFGLFAVFSMLRYRTEALAIKDMTYLFLVIAIALLCSMSPVSYYELLMINGLVLLLAFVLETRFIFPMYRQQDVEYEKINHIAPEHREHLRQELSTRTGLNVVHIDVLSISYLRDTASLRLHYKDH